MKTGCEHCDWTYLHTPSQDQTARNEMFRHMRDAHPKEFKAFMDWVLS